MVFFERGVPWEVFERKRRHLFRENLGYRSCVPFFSRHKVYLHRVYLLDDEQNASKVLFPPTKRHKEQFNLLPSPCQEINFSPLVQLAFAAYYLKFSLFFLRSGVGRGVRGRSGGQSDLILQKIVKKGNTTLPPSFFSLEVPMFWWHGEMSEWAHVYFYPERKKERKPPAAGNKFFFVFQKIGEKKQCLPDAVLHCIGRNMKYDCFRSRLYF